MPFSMIAIPLGACVGVVLGLTGAGGAVLSVPILTLILGLPLLEAAPIGLFAVTISAGLGAMIALRHGMLRYRAAMLMAAAGSVASPLGVWLAHLVPERLLTGTFFLLLLWIGSKSWLQARGRVDAPEALRSPPCRINPSTGRFAWTLPCARAMSLSGLAAGFLSGLLGVGGGFIIIPSLRRHTDLAMNACVATSMGVLTLVSITGVGVSMMHAPLNFAVGIPFMAGAVAGMMLGRGLSARLGGNHLQRAFALLCLGVAIALGWSLLRALL